MTKLGIAIEYFRNHFIFICVYNKSRFFILFSFQIKVIREIFMRYKISGTLIRCHYSTVHDEGVIILFIAL